MVHGWHEPDLTKMAETRIKPSDTEKITINLGAVDLGHIDLLVQEGFYSNRTDLIRTAIRNQLALHADVMRQTVARRTLVLGLQEFSKRDLEGVRKSGRKLRIQVLGLVRIADDVSPALAMQTIESIAVLGAFHASAAVKLALADRTQ
jgi:Arc/MetJ-type ribon-helix-helix transcriptional regulator